MLREIGNKVVDNWRKLCEVGVKSLDIVVLEAVFPVVVSFIRLAVVWVGYVSHTTVCYPCLMWSKMRHKYFHNFNMIELQIFEVLPNKLFHISVMFARYVEKWRAYMNWAIDLRFPYSSEKFSSNCCWSPLALVRSFPFPWKHVHNQQVQCHPFSTWPVFLLNRTQTLLTPLWLFSDRGM
jgi:hypothetical protein